MTHRSTVAWQQHCRRNPAVRCGAFAVACLALCLGCLLDSTAKGYTKESPEVRAMVDKAKKFLETDANEQRLGGRCLIGLIFIKEGEKDHPRVQEAAAACVEAAKQGNADDVYSNGLAIIFLSDYDPKKYAKELQFFIAAMQKRQKPHGGWGYDGRETGDTSQSQYGCLGFWEAYQKGAAINPGSIDGVARWLINTQDPSGAWGYQGEIGAPGKLVPQTEITCSMVSAAMGSLLICADLVGILQPGAATEEADSLPSLVKLKSDRDEGRPRLGGTSINRQQLLDAVRKGDAWMAKNYEVEIERYTSYYLYALERYKSLQAILEGSDDPEPEWYNNGVTYLMKTQAEDGTWETGCGKECDTAFSVLFLIRSMETALGSMGEGAALAGRGLPSDLSKLRVQGGQLVASAAKTELDGLLGDLDDAKLAEMDAVINGSSVLDLGDISDKDIRRLKQLVRSGEPAARIIAVKALAQTGDFDHVPTLLYALADPDPRLAIEARDGLRFVSRRFDGFGPPDRFTRQEQLEAVDRWVRWYQGVRPDVPVVLQ